MADENPGVGNGFLGMFNAFVDPAGLAKASKAKLFWLWPLLVVCIIVVVFNNLMEPYSLQVMEASLATIPADRQESVRRFSKIGVQVAPFVIPVFLFGLTALFALLVKVTGSIVGLATKFRDVFSLMAACSLISSLQFAANYVVLRAKGDEVTTREQLTPPFGLDIFIPAHGALLAILNFFSIFEIWYLVIFGLALAYLTGSSKGKAFAAITPAWLIPLIFKIIGSFFGGSTSN